MGAKPVVDTTSELQKSLAIQFRFDPDVGEKLLAMTPPSKAWLEQYDTPIRATGGEDAAVIASLEAAANRFLRGNIKPASKVNQKATLEAIERHSQALIGLLTSPEVTGTIADPFVMLAATAAQEGRGTSRDGYEHAYHQMLLSLQLFAKHRLATKVEPQEDDPVEKIKRRKEYPRFVLIADLLATHKRITGLSPAAYATKDRWGVRKRSEAIEFLSVALPPILRAARVKAAEVDDQVLKIEIQKVKAEWDAERNPELAYTFADWGAKFQRPYPVKSD